MKLASAMSVFMLSVFAGAAQGAEFKLKLPPGLQEKRREYCRCETATVYARCSLTILEEWWRFTTKAVCRISGFRKN
jgi:hypothetical protein